MTDVTGTWTYVTDNFGEMTSDKTNASGWPTVTCPDSTTATTCYAYDADGNVTDVYYPLPSGEACPTAATTSITISTPRTPSRAWWT
jgi:hypothetical protein